MPIVKWPIPIIGKLADNRPTIGAPLIITAALMHSSCVETTWLVNCPSVSDMFASSNGKLFHADGPAAEMLRGPKPTVLVNRVTKLPRSHTQLQYRTSVF